MPYGGKRRSRTAGGVTTKYKWGRGWDVVNEEDGNGTLQKTYIGHMAEVPGANPAAGAYAYYATDLIRSTRGLFDANKAQVAGYEFTPYGDLFASSGTVSTTHLYTGHDWDSATNLYFAPYRYFSPDVARWISRDPLGTLASNNMYGYVDGRVTVWYDREGLIGICGLIMATIYMTSLASEPFNDRYKHCFVTCEISKACGESDAESAGEYNELIDAIMKQFGLQQHGWDSADEEANKHGLECGGECSDSDCGSCCESKGHDSTTPIGS